MVHYYTINKLPIKGAEHISLSCPITRELLWLLVIVSSSDQECFHALINLKSISDISELFASCRYVECWSVKFSMHSSCFLYCVCYICFCVLVWNNLIWEFSFGFLIDNFS
jgi:hypothetical protein